MNDEIKREVLVEAVDVAVLDGGLEKGVEHVEAGAVSGEPGAGTFIPPNGRTLILPSGCLLQGHPQCSSW